MQGKERKNKKLINSDFCDATIDTVALRSSNRGTAEGQELPEGGGGGREGGKRQVQGPTHIVCTSDRQGLTSTGEACFFTSRKERTSWKGREEGGEKKWGEWKFEKTRGRGGGGRQYVCGLTGYCGDDGYCDWGLFSSG